MIIDTVVKSLSHTTNSNTYKHYQYNLTCIYPATASTVKTKYNIANGHLKQMLQWFNDSGVDDISHMRT